MSLGHEDLSVILWTVRMSCLWMTKTNSLVNTAFVVSSASDGLHMPDSCQAGGDLTAEVSCSDNFCLALLCTVCVMSVCSVFWHHGVLCVGVLAHRAPQGSSCWTVVKGGGSLRWVWGFGELQQQRVCWAAAIQTNRNIFQDKKWLREHVCLW